MRLLYNIKRAMYAETIQCDNDYLRAITHHSDKLGDINLLKQQRKHQRNAKDTHSQNATFRNRNPNINNR